MCLFRKWLIVMLYVLVFLLIMIIGMFLCVLFGGCVLSNWCVVINFVGWFLNWKCCWFLSMLILVWVSLSVCCMQVSGNVYVLLFMFISRLWMMDSVSGNCSMKCVLCFGLLWMWMVLCIVLIILCMVLSLILCLDIFVICLCIEKFGSSRKLSNL